MKPVTGLFIILALMMTACQSGQTGTAAAKIQLVVHTRGVPDPAADHYVYYRVFLNHREAGRTTTGLMSQNKQAEFNIEQNRHLLVFEEWILDGRLNRYVKKNNIDQPKPSFVYVDLVKKRHARVSVVIEGDGTAITVEYR